MDVPQAEAAGKSAKEKFIKGRFQNQSEMSFFDPINKQKLLTMECCNKKVTLTSTQGKDELLATKSNFDLAKMPPCQDSLILHVQHVNYRVACYKRAHRPIFWRPSLLMLDKGGRRQNKGSWSQCVMCTHPTRSLIDLIETADLEEDEEEEDDIDYDEMLQNLVDDNDDNG